MAEFDCDLFVVGGGSGGVVELSHGGELRGGKRGREDVRFRGTPRLVKNCIQRVLRFSKTRDLVRFNASSSCRLRLKPQDLSNTVLLSGAEV